MSCNATTAFTPDARGLQPPGVAPQIFHWLLLFVCFFLPGCADTDAAADATSDTSRQEMVEELFDNAIGLLADLDEFDSADALQQAVARLNQWLATKQPLAEWRIDPLVATLPAELRELPSLASLAELKFTRNEGFALQEAVWMRDVARLAVGDETDDVRRAARLFDWTVRNVQLDPADPVAPLPHLPYETLVFGHGTALDRAWVFMLLARQQELDVVLLATGGDQKQSPRPWLAALLHDKKLYLFDPELGLPIPRADGTGIATLEEALVDERVLGQLDLDAEHPYRVKRGDLKRVVALIEASPLYLSQRAKLVELRLAGSRRMVLSVDASDLAQRLRQYEPIASAELWTLPYERIARKRSLNEKEREAARVEFSPFMEPTTTLWRGRVSHLLGKLAGDDGAQRYYLRCRASDVDLAAAKAAGKLDPASEARGLLLKQNASYWLGLLAFERGRYDTAQDYFEARTLVPYPAGPWTESARYNLGRTLEAQGQTAQAAAAYRQTKGPQRHGNLLRARGLERATE